MSNEYYTPTANPADNSFLNPSLIRAEFTALETSFGKLPTMAANGGKMVIVNSGATALEATALLSVSGTTLVQNAATITISQNFVETRAAGAAASGASTIHGRVTTLSGHADTTSGIGVYKFETDISGSNNLASASSVVPRVDYSGSGTLALVLLASGNLNHIGSGSITYSYGIGSVIAMQSTGGITTAGLFTARIPVFSSTGAITTLIGFDCQDVGHASLITNCHSFRAQDHTASVTLNTAFKGEMSAGATKYNLYMSGTAQNLFNGDLSIYAGTGIPAGGTAGTGYKFSSTANFGVFFGSGAPTLAAAKGSLYLRSDGSSTSTRAYVNTDGGTTWSALTTAA